MENGEKIKEAFSNFVKEHNENAHTLQQDFVQDFANILDTSLFKDTLSSATSFAHAVCGLFALIYICNLVWKSWSNGSQLDLLKIIKPLVIGFCIMNFNVVVGSVDLVLSGMGYATQEFSNLCSKNSAEQIKDFANEVYTEKDIVHPNENNLTLDQKARQIDSGDKLNSTINNENVTEGSQTYDDKVLQKLGFLEGLAASIVNEFQLWVTASIQEALGQIASLVMLCILYMGFLGKCIFYFFGPILFALELVPGMEGKISGFFKKYITYSLYPCCINVVNGILITSMVSLSNFDNYFFVHVAISFIGIFMFCSVPSVAHQLMETATNQLGSAAMVPISYAANKAGNKIASSAASFASGGTSKIIEAGAKSAKGTAELGKKAASGSNMKGGNQ